MFSLGSGYKWAQWADGFIIPAALSLSLAPGFQLGMWAAVQFCDGHILVPYRIFIDLFSKTSATSVQCCGFLSGFDHGSGSVYIYV